MVRYLIQKRHKRQRETKREQLEQTLESNGIDGDHPNLEDTIDYISMWSPPIVKKIALLLLVTGVPLLLYFIGKGYSLFNIGYAAVLAAAGGILYWKYQNATSIEDDLTNDPQQFVR
jgi:hypothetical protein